MIQEAYCSFEVAKLLKWKGFDVPCNSWYMLCGDGSVKTFMLTEPVNHNQYDGFPWTVSRPTHQMALAWLRAKGFMIDITTFFGDDGKPTWAYDIWLGDGQLEIAAIDCGKPFDNYEEAVEAALKYTLENLL